MISGQDMAGQSVTREELLELRRMVEEIRDSLKATERHDTDVQQECQSVEESQTLEPLNASISTINSDVHLQIHDSVTANTNLQSLRTVEDTGMAQLSPLRETVMEGIHELTNQLKEQRGDVKGLNDAIRDLHNKFNKMEETTFQQTIHNTSVKIPNHLDAVKHSVERLANRCSIHDELKDSIKAEFVAINNIVDEKLSEFRNELQDTVRNIQEKVKEEVQSTADKMAQELKASVQTCCGATKQDVQTSASVMTKLEASAEKTVTQARNTLEQFLDVANNNLREELQDGYIKIIETSQKALEKKMEEISAKTEDAKRQVEATMQEISMGMKNDLDNSQRQLTTEMRAINSELRKHIDETNVQLQGLKHYLDENTKTIVDASERGSQLLVDKVDNLKTTTTNTRNQILKSFTDYTQITQKQVTTKVKDSVNEMTENMYRTKRETFAVIQAESQLTRDRVAGPLPSHTNYTLDFYIEEFKSLVRSGKARHSLPCYINQLQSSVVGNAFFTTDGKMQIWLVYDRHPREHGLLPRARVTLTVKATIIDIYRGTLSTRLVGEKTFTMDEAWIRRNCDEGKKIGEIPVDDLVQKGYGEVEGYSKGALLIRYEIHVL